MTTNTPESTTGDTCPFCGSELEIIPSILMMYKCGMLPEHEMDRTPLCLALERGNKLEAELIKIKGGMNASGETHVELMQRNASEHSALAEAAERRAEKAEAELAEVKKTKRIKVVAHSLEGNGFGAYLSGSLQDGEAIILLDSDCQSAVDIDPSKTLARDNGGRGSSCLPRGFRTINHRVRYFSRLWQKSKGMSFANQRTPSK